jgi:hypothetical protein
MRKNRALRFVAAALFGAGALACAPRAAHATEQDIFNEPANKGKSPQHFAFELRLSPYTPNIDKESGLGGKTPFKDTFGSGNSVLVGFEFDYQAVRIPWVGTLGPGFSAGYWQVTAKSFTLTGDRSAEDTSLKLYPMYLAAVLRGDTLWRNYRIPVVPYAKAGIGMTLWEMTNPGGTSTSTSTAGTTVKGHGYTLGTQWALGIGIALDSLDQGASRNLDNSVGINNTYLYAEYYLAAMTGIAQNHPLQVGTDTWCAGLAFEF